MQTNNQLLLNNSTLSSRNIKELDETYNGAEWMYERLVKIINSFEENLPDTMQAGGCLVSFQEITFSIDNINYWNPDIIKFFGTLPDGSSVELVQHTSQLNLLLIAVPLKNPEKPRRKIGFAIGSKKNE